MHLVHIQTIQVIFKQILTENFIQFILLIENRHNFPDLSYNATNKLRHLTIVSLASKCRTISYSILSKELDISNLRELEDLIIEGFYANIIKGKLDQQNNQLEIDFSIGRDVTDQNIDEVLNILEEWGSNCTIALKTIETQIANANNYKQQQLELQNNIETEVKCLIPLYSIIVKLFFST